MARGQTPQKQKRIMTSGWTIKAWLTGVLILVLMLRGTSQEPGQLLASADAAFQSGDYSTAIESYQNLIGEGYRQAEIYYNLGNCYSAKGDRGHAVINYERALRLDPHNRDTRHNLALISKPVEDAITVLPAFFLPAGSRR